MILFSPRAWNKLKVHDHIYSFFSFLFFRQTDKTNMEWGGPEDLNILHGSNPGKTCQCKEETYSISNWWIVETEKSNPQCYSAHKSISSPVQSLWLFRKIKRQAKTGNRSLLFPVTTLSKAQCWLRLVCFHFCYIYIFYLRFPITNKCFLTLSLTWCECARGQPWGFPLSTVDHQYNF